MGFHLFSFGAEFCCIKASMKLCLDVGVTRVETPAHPVQNGLKSSENSGRLLSKVTWLTWAERNKVLLS